MSGRTGIARIVHGLRWRGLHAINLLSLYILSFVALAKTEIRFRRGKIYPRHSLPGELIVSLTSYPPRFPTLLPTLKCLLTQSARPDRVILWVAESDMAALPPPVLALCGQGLEIRPCKDIGPYKKIIPALAEFPEAFIATADDDLYYSPDWLHDLAAGWTMNSEEGGNRIVCHRAHGIKLDTEGKPAPYNEWDFDVTGPLLSAKIFPTGVGGVLYPPGCFAGDVLDESKFSALSPKADDVWLFWMGRLASALYQKTPGRMKTILWPGTQKTGLFNENIGTNANDAKIGAMIAHYGWPVE